MRIWDFDIKRSLKLSSSGYRDLPVSQVYCKYLKVKMERPIGQQKVQYVFDQGI